jgi:hypothetical protein
MLPKFFASWLVVLVLVPFTAPFSTCDLIGIVGAARGHHQPFARRTFGAGRERRHAEEDFTSSAPVPRVPAISSAGRVRLLPLSSLALAQTKVSSSSARFVWSAVSAGYIREYTVITTILRV